MTNDEESRFCRLLDEMRAEVAGLRHIVAAVSNRFLEEGARLTKLESWRGRLEKSEEKAEADDRDEREKREQDIRELRELNLKQLELLHAQNVAFKEAEAKRDGARAEAAAASEKLERRIKVWLPVVLALCTGLGWLISHSDRLKVMQ